MSQVTQLLSAIDSGDTQAATELMVVVYQTLRELAGQLLAREQAGQTLQATELVHEAYLRLIGPANADGFANRHHFFAAAAEAMRRVLVDRARARSSIRRGGEFQRIPIDELQLAAPEADEQVLQLNDALDELTRIDALAAELVKLRYFAGMTIPEAAAVLKMAPRSADFLWAYARSWLKQHLNDS